MVAAWSRTRAFPVAVAASPGASVARIDLFGNRAFANRMLGWLGEQEFLLRFPMADRSGTPLKVNMRGLRLIFYLVERRAKERS